MTPQAQAVWSALEFRRPMLLRNVEPLGEAQMRWRPGPQRNSIAWQLWHIAEVEDNWVRSLVTREALRFPFGVQVREASDEQYPAKARLLEYFREVREMTRRRLDAAAPGDFGRRVKDPDFGEITILDVWSGVVTSFAWHAGQIALTAKLLPDTPVTTMTFEYWKRDMSKRRDVEGPKAINAESVLLQRLLGHNAWATRVLLERCRDLTPAQLARKFDIGPGSVHDTLVHVIGAMRRWADRIAGREVRPRLEEGGRRFAPGELLELLDEASSDFAAVAERVAADERLDETMEVRLPDREAPLVLTRGTAIVHAMTHGVHHRAQVLNMLRRLQVGDLPDVDAIEWELAEAGLPAR